MELTVEGSKHVYMELVHDLLAHRRIDEEVASDLCAELFETAVLKFKTQKANTLRSTLSRPQHEDAINYTKQRKAKREKAQQEAQWQGQRIDD
ncbi:hypothetical protein FRC03_001904 [Tulasnella sp. 419]|nr:hypothetical protein FRC02_005347 [Tulasnella sp. 418]KAG8964342.1 hypothetical protein FRC03_001904 [Tulasnella sp. 419]